MTNTIHNILMLNTQEYQLIRSVRTSGRSWIKLFAASDKRQKRASTTSFEGTFWIDNLSASENRLFGFTASYGTSNFMFVRLYDKKVSSGWGVSALPSVNVNAVMTLPDNEINVKCSLNYASFNGHEVFASGADWAPDTYMNQSFLLGAARMNESATDQTGALKGRIGRCAVFESGVMTYEYLPALRLADREVGFFETVSGQFFKSVTIQSFTIGEK